MAQVLDHPRQLTMSRIEKILTQALNQKGGIRFRVTKYGERYISPRFVIAINEPVIVEKQNDFIVIHIGDDTKKQVVYLKPANEEAQLKFFNWLHVTEETFKEGGKCEQPVSVCFDQIGR